MTATTFDRLASIIARETGEPIETITPEVTLDNLHLLMRAAIECEIENEFGIMVRPKAFDACVNFGALADLIDDLKKAA